MYMRFRIQFVVVMLISSIGISSCCHRETYQCIDSPPPVAFIGFDSLDLQSVEVLYLKHGAVIRTALDSITFLSGEAYPIGKDSTVYPGIVRTDTSDLEIYLPALARVYTIGDLQKENKGSRTVKICFNEKIDFACNNFYTHYSLNGVGDTLVESYGAVIPIVK